MEKSLIVTCLSLIDTGDTTVAQLHHEPSQATLYVNYGKTETVEFEPKKSYKITFSAIPEPTKE